MCEFVSLKEKDGEVFFLTNDDLKPKKLKEFKEFNKHWRRDLPGHGAIEWFYPKMKGVGKQKERTGFGTPDNFPDEIVQTIKSMKMTKIGFNLGLLNDMGRAKYEEVEQQTYAKYHEVQQQAYAKYEEVKQPAFWKVFKQKKYRNPEWR